MGKIVIFLLFALLNSQSIEASSMAESYCTQTLYSKYFSIIDPESKTLWGVCQIDKTKTSAMSLYLDKNGKLIEAFYAFLLRGAPVPCGQPGIDGNAVCKLSGGKVKNFQAQSSSEQAEIEMCVFRDNSFIDLETLYEGPYGDRLPFNVILKEHHSILEK